MTEPKFTKGPWVVQVDASSSVTGFPLILSEHYVVVGHEGLYGDIEQDFANAHLIAAAPDMFEVLEGAPDIWDYADEERLLTIDRTKKFMRDFTAWQERRTAALKKARGEQS